MGYPQYEKLKEEREQIRQRIKNIGFACAAHLDVIGIRQLYYLSLDFTFAPFPTISGRLPGKDSLSRKGEKFHDHLIYE